LKTNNTYEGDFGYFYDNVNNDFSTYETSNNPHPNHTPTLQRTLNLREKQVHR